MSNLSNALQELRERHKHALREAEKLQSAISVIEELAGRNGSVSAHNGAQPGRTVSAASRKRMALAQKARWAKAKKQSEPAAAAKTGSTPVKRTMSASARRKIGAAQRARWAKLRKAA